MISRTQNTGGRGRKLPSHNHAVCHPRRPNRTALMLFSPPSGKSPTNWGSSWRRIEPLRRPLEPVESGPLANLWGDPQCAAPSAGLTIGKMRASKTNAAQSLRLTCPSCGAEHRRDAKFCDSCPAIDGTRHFPTEKVRAIRSGGLPSEADTTKFLADHR